MFRFCNHHFSQSEREGCDSQGICPKGVQRVPRRAKGIYYTHEIHLEYILNGFHEYIKYIFLMDFMGVVRYPISTRLG